MAKQYGTDENIDVIINVDKGDLELWRNREIVEDNALEDENIEIAYSDAVKIEPDFEVGEEVSEQIFLKDSVEDRYWPFDKHWFLELWI